MAFGAALGSFLAYEGAFGAIFGVTLEALWVYVGYIRMILCHFRITLESLWSHFGCMRVDFQKTIIPQSILMILYKSGIHSGALWDHSGLTLGI